MCTPSSAPSPGPSRAAPRAPTSRRCRLSSTMGPGVKLEVSSRSSAAEADAERTIEIRRPSGRRRMAAPRGTAIDLSETAGDPKRDAREALKDLDRLHRQEGNRFAVLPIVRKAVGGLNFWDRQNRVDRGMSRRPMWQPGRRVRTERSLPADGIGDDQWTDQRKQQLVTSLHETLTKAELVVGHPADRPDRRRGDGSAAADAAGGRRLQGDEESARASRSRGHAVRGADVAVHRADGDRLFGGSGGGGQGGREYANRTSKLTIVGGAMAGQVLDPSGIKALATLPSLDRAARQAHRHARQTPATRVATRAAGAGGQLARVLAAYASKGEAA